MDHYLTSYIKINSKFIKDINVRSKTLELLEEKRRVSLQLECWERFLKQDTESSNHNENVDNLAYIIIYNLYAKKPPKKSEK